MRSPTSSTVPVIPLTVTTSPTPYWFSRIMNTPDRKSRTIVWAPKPIAIPAIPALASSGAMLTPTALSAKRMATATMTKVPTEVSIPDTAVARAR